MDEEQAVFEQLTLSDFKKSSSTALNTFNKFLDFIITMTEIINDHINSTGCSGEFYVVFKHFEKLESLIWNILKNIP